MWHIISNNKKNDVSDRSRCELIKACQFNCCEMIYVCNIASNICAFLVS